MIYEYSIYINDIENTILYDRNSLWWENMILEFSLFCSPKLHLFDQNAVKSVKKIIIIIVEMLMFVSSVLTGHYNTHFCLLSSRWRSHVCLLCFPWTSKALSWKWLLWPRKTLNSGTERERSVWQQTFTSQENSIKASAEGMNVNIFIENICLCVSGLCQKKRSRIIW